MTDLTLGCLVWAAVAIIVVSVSLALVGMIIWLT